MFCNYCGTSNPEVARFCQKCGKPIVDSPRSPSAPAPQALVSAPLVDPPGFSAPVAETLPTPVAAPAHAFPSSPDIKPQSTHTGSRTIVAVVAASFAVLLIGGVVFMRVRGAGSRTSERDSNLLGSVASSPDGRMIAAEERQKQNQLAAAAAAENQKEAQGAPEQRQPDPLTGTPPPASPSVAPTSPPDDDPIASGGFITPPTDFNAMMCVPADIANDSSWSKPESGSKMAAFRDLVANHIVAIAKPGWEYWIVPGQYEKFDPATATSGNQLVSAVSPESGRFDQFNPQCPSGYASFWVKVSH
jgi:hypothetical protein